MKRISLSLFSGPFPVQCVQINTQLDESCSLHSKTMVGGLHTRCLDPAESIVYALCCSFVLDEMFSKAAFKACSAAQADIGEGGTTYEETK